MRRGKEREREKEKMPGIKESKKANKSGVERGRKKREREASHLTNRTQNLCTKNASFLGSLAHHAHCTHARRIHTGVEFVREFVSD